uniref:Uncharacterized protein n=1 Tax=Anguilla anguilla TaxID=7936 RepID=A0A0E9W0Z1_ANGAN
MVTLHVSAVPNPVHSRVLVVVQRARSLDGKVMFQLSREREMKETLKP